MSAITMRYLHARLLFVNVYFYFLLAESLIMYREFNIIGKEFDCRNCQW